MRNVKFVAYAAAITLAGVAIVVAGPAGPAAAATCKHTASSDFNGDGIGDVAIGESKQTAGAPGQFHVLYGTRTGLTASSPQDSLFTSTSSAGGFGAAMAAGDFNDNGCSDLAVANPSATVGGKANAGSVSIYTGATGGLVDAGLTLVPADVTGGASVTSGQFGYAVATGDVNGDGFADLVVGAPGENAIYVFPGSASGLTGTGKRYAEGIGGVPGTTGDNGFGNALAIGDFNGNGAADVAIGVPGENNDAGAVIVLNGGASVSAPLTTTGAKLWSQGSSGVPGSPESFDLFGSALATGDFMGNGRIDLAIGVPGEKLGTIINAGLVNVIYSAGSAGLAGTGAQDWSQESTDVDGTAQANDMFGSALAAGDFNGNGKDDLAIGSPGEGIDGAAQAGFVNVLPGTGNGLTGANSTGWSQSTTGIDGVAEAQDYFGFALTAVRVTASSRDDLVVGVPGETLDSITSAGYINFIPGSANGLTATGSMGWDDNSTDVMGTSCAKCIFGIALA
jgi:FG-GAP repeat